MHGIVVEEAIVPVVSSIRRLTHPTMYRTLVRLRLLWLALSWSLCLMLVVIGSAYLLRGPHRATGPYALIGDQLPGGMRSHGLLMVLIGFALAYWLCPTLDASPDPRPGFRYVLVVAGCYSLLVAAAFLGASHVDGRTSASLTALWSFAGIAGIALGLCPLPTPDHLDAAREHDRQRDRGADPEVRG